MQKVIENIKEVQKSNLVFLIEKQSNLDKIEFLRLDSKIKNKIREVVKK